MSVTSGFFNSVNGDRRYDARQMTALFNGIINDGIFANIGTAFTVTANGGNSVVVGPGRAWFNSTWIDNDAPLPLTLDISEVLLPRWDAVVITVDQRDSVRNASIDIVKGTPASNPVYPTMKSTNEVHQYPLVYIYRPADSNSITQSNITSMIGTSSAPYITGILQVQNIDNIVAQWYDEWAQWYANYTLQAEQYLETTEGDIDGWFGDMQAEFDNWFNNLKGVLGDDVAAQLESRVTSVEDEVESLKKSVSDGKTAVAGAVTEMGVTTASDASFQTIADNIRAIETGVDTSDATALAADILSGKSAYVDGEHIAGTMPNQGTVNQTLDINGSYTIPKGYHSGSGKVSQNITTKAAATYTPGTSDQTIAAGQYLSDAQTIKGDPNLVASNIMQGKTIFGVTGTATGMSGIGKVSKSYYVYKGQTIKAGDFVKYITGTAGVGASSEHSLQTSTGLYTPYIASTGYSIYTPKIYNIGPNKVIRSWYTVYSSNQYAASQVGTVNFTNSPNVSWGTMVKQGPYTTSTRFSVPSVFEKITDDGGYYIEVGGSKDSSSAVITVSVFKADGTTVKSGITQSLSTGYASAHACVHGVKHIGNNRCIIIVSANPSGSTKHAYALIVTYNASSNSLTFSTKVTIDSTTNFYNSSSVANAEAGIYIAEKSSTILVAVCNLAYRLSVSGTTVSKIWSGSVSTASPQFYAYEPESDILVTGYIGTLRWYQDGYEATVGLKITPATFDGSTMKAGTQVQITHTYRVPNAVANASSNNMYNNSCQSRAFRVEKNMFLMPMSAVYMGSNASDSTYFHPYGRALVKFDGSTTFSFSSVDMDNDSRNTTRQWQSLCLIEGTCKLIDWYGRQVTSLSANATHDMYDIVKDLYNGTISNVNYIYETQVALAESNTDIGGVAITGGSGGSGTTHSGQVTVRCVV